MNSPSALTRWAIHPQPLPDETVTSWLVRGARANASSLQSWLAADAGLDSVSITSDFDRLDRPDYWERLSQRTAIVGGVAALRAMSFLCLPTRVTSWLLSSRSAAKERRARWCPSCLATDTTPYFRRSWRWEWVAWCPRDGTRMRDACPSCGEALDYQQVHWRRALTACWNCGAPIVGRSTEGPPQPAFVSLAVAAALGRLQELTDDDVDALWSLQRFVRLCGWRRQEGTFTPPPFIPALGEMPTYPSMSPEAIAAAFAIAWHLLGEGRVGLSALVERHQGNFNQAIQYRCPGWLQALHRPVRRALEPLTEERVVAAIERLRKEGVPIHYATVAAVVGRDDHAVSDNRRWRALVDAAAPPAIGPTGRLKPLIRKHARKGSHRVQPEWLAAMEARVSEARKQLRARDEPPSRAAIARQAGIKVDVLARYERAVGRRLVGLPAERRLEKVREAVAALQARGTRVSGLAVARALTWNRSVISGRPELRAIVRAAMAAPITPPEVTAAIDAIRARGERVTTRGVSMELGRDRDPFYRKPGLLDLVKAAQARQHDEAAERVRAAVKELQARDEPVTFRAVAAVIGKDEHYFERPAQRVLRELVPSPRARRARGSDGEEPLLRAAERGVSGRRRGDVGAGDRR